MGKTSPIDMTGRRYGRLSIIGPAPKLPTNHNKRWFVQCDCGTIKTADGNHIRGGRIVSCGCYVAEVIRSDEHTAKLQNVAGTGRTKKHGRSKTPVYAVWKTMRMRCRNPKCADWEHYGGRGIKVCDRWDDFAAFEADMGPRTDGMTLDRINVDGDYEPGNCRWATWLDQAANKRPAA